jgi:hypothetical protein
MCAAFFSQGTGVDDCEGPPAKDTSITLFGHGEEKAKAGLATSTKQRQMPVDSLRLRFGVAAGKK